MNKMITSKLHSIIQKCIVNKINANIEIQKLNNAFPNVQQVVTQLFVNLLFSLLLYC